MNKSSSIFFCFFALTIALTTAPFFNSYCQDIPDPEFPSRPYAFDGKSLLPVERTEAKLETKGKGLGYGGYEKYWGVQGDKSTTRFGQAALPTLIVKVDANTDPSDVIVIARGDMKKDKRRFLVSKTQSPFAGGGSKNVSDGQLKLSFKKVRDNVYQIVFPNYVEPGEYAVLPMTDNTNVLTATAKISCFGID